MSTSFVPGHAERRELKRFFFVESTMFDPIQFVRVWSSISNSLSEFRKDWINIINYYKLIVLSWAEIFLFESNFLLFREPHVNINDERAR